jgi:hypothetical protein
MEQVTSSDIKNVLDEESKTGVRRLAKAVGILDPDRDKSETKSAYTDMHKNSIPVSVFKEQIGETKINGFVERIKTYVYTDGIQADPDVKKKAEEKLRREIAKFQVRQEEAQRKYEGYQPTVIVGTQEALTTLYMQEDPLKDSESVHTSPADDFGNNMSLATPFQRAARAAQGREEEERRQQLIAGTWHASNVQTAKRSDVTVINTSVEENEEKQDTVDEIKHNEAAEQVEKKPYIAENLQTDAKKMNEKDSQSEMVEESQDHTDGVMDFTFKSGEDIRSRRRAEKETAKINKRIARAEEKAAIAAAKAEKAKREVEIISRKKDM